MSGYDKSQYSPEARTLRFKRVTERRIYFSEAKVEYQETLDTISRLFKGKLDKKLFAPKGNQDE